MIRPERFLRALVSIALFSAMASGCVTVQAPALSMESLFKPKVDKARFEEAVEEVLQEPQHPTQLKLAYAKWMEDVGQFVEARRHYTEIHRNEPENVDAILGLARINLVSGDAESAESTLKKAVKLAPDSPAAQSALGEFYASQGRWDEAVDPLSKAMLAAPHESSYRYQLAVALVHVGDIDSALPHFIRTVGDAEAHYNVGLVLNQEGHVEEARRHFEMALTKKPELSQAQHWLAYLRQQAGERSTVPDAGTTTRDAPAIVPAGHSTAKPSGQSASTIPAPRQLTAQQSEQFRNQQPHPGL